MKSGFLLLIIPTVVVLAGCIPKPPPTKTISSLDQFQQDMAFRSSGSIGSAEDFKIVVTQAEYPIGTLLRSGSTIPVEYTACLPSTTPPKANTPSLFPSYTLDKKVALDIGLDNEVFKRLADAGVTIGDADKVILSVSGANLKVLSDSDIKKITDSHDCNNAMSGQAVWLIRGYISGQRNFLLNNNNSANLKGKVVKIASFDIEVGGGSRTLSLVDSAEVGFLQVVSQVSYRTNTTEVDIKKPTNTGSMGKIYIQRDRQDTTTNGEAVYNSLRARSFNVVKEIERIDTSKMPLNAQVRYFNDGDINLAQEAFSELNKIYPTAALRKIGLPAPVGQIEVWLPKYKAN